MKKYSRYLLPLIIGLALLAVPLLRDFHFESAILAGIIGCFWAGIRAADYHSKQHFFPSIKILGYLYLAALPLFIYSIITGCLTFDGFGFWILIPLPSVFFGAAIGRLICSFWVPFPKTITVIILLFCAGGIWLYEFMTFPQVYFYNHVWGIWPGPIYDEAVQLTGSLIYFRWLTFLWIVLLWMIPSWSKNAQTKLITVLAVLSLMFSYFNLNEMGVISPRESIQKQLGGHHQSEHFEYYYDEGFYTNDEIESWALYHEFYFQQITELLEIDWPSGRKIESYLYAHAWQKKKITGAKFTSYVPIWLEQDQLHIAKQQLDRVLKHELVHVISKQFGNELFNGSWSIGLIEGLAEGIAKDASPRSTLHQIVAADSPFPTASDMKSALSVWGFYRSAGAISYSTAGSFVHYLLDEFPVQSFKRAYSTSDFKSAYSQSFESLISGWHQTLNQTEIDSVDREVSEFIFAQRSLFEKPCPHSVTKELRLWDDYRYLLADHDTTSAYNVLDKLYSQYANNDFVKDEWVRSQLKQGKYAEAANAIPQSDTLLTLRVLKADALFLTKGYQSADTLLQIIAPEVQASSTRNFRHTLSLRKDSLVWNHHTQRRFSNNLADSLAFASVNLPNKILDVNKALDLKNHKKLVQYAAILFNENSHPSWFDIYERMISQLSFIGEQELAEAWLDKISTLSLRLRYQERLEELYQWHLFLDSRRYIVD